MPIDRINLFGTNYNENGADSVDPYENAGRPTGWRGINCYCVKFPTPTLTPTPIPTAPPDCLNTGGLNTFIIWNLTNSLEFAVYNYEPEPLVVNPSNGVLGFNQYAVPSFNCLILENPTNVFTGQPVYVSIFTTGSTLYNTTNGWLRITLPSALFNSGNPLYTVDTIFPYTIDEAGILLDMTAYLNTGYSGVLFTINYTCICEANYTMVIEEAGNPNPTLTPTPTPSPTLTFAPTITPSPTLRAVGWRGINCYCLQEITNTPTPTPFPTIIGGTCPPAGTKTGNVRCVGLVLQEELHNGFCQTYWSDITSGTGVCCDEVRPTGWRCLQSYCATVECPSYGTRLGSYCNGTDFIVIYADGNCGQFEENYGNNGICCTPVPTVTLTPTPTPTASVPIPTYTSGFVTTRLLNYVGNPPIDNIIGSCNNGCLSINIYYGNALTSLWHPSNPVRINNNTPNNGGNADVEVFDYTLGRSVFSRTKFVDNNNFSPIYTQGFPNIGPASNNTVTLPVFIRQDLQNNLSFNYICEEDATGAIVASGTNSTNFILTQPTGTYDIKNCCNCEGISACISSANYQTDSLGQPFIGSYYDVSIPALPTVSGRLYRLYIEVFQNGISYLQHQLYFVPA